MKHLLCVFVDDNSVCVTKREKRKKKLYLHFLCLSFSPLWVNFFIIEIAFSTRERFAARTLDKKNATALFSERQSKRELRTKTKTRIRFL